MTSATTPARENVFVARDYSDLCEHVAAGICSLVQSKPDAVLGLATGATPVGVYDSLARRHREGSLDFSRVTCFNLDEYYPMPSDAPQSYHLFMETHLFRRVPVRRWHVPDGRPRSREEIDADCRRYEEAIRAAGGIDLQLLGIGRSGHVGFNEPGSRADSRTRLVTLNPITREDAAEGLGGLEHVPTQAVSMGIGTILEARTIVLMASGAAKAEMVAQALMGDITDQVPASLIRRHSHVRFCLDADAASLLEDSRHDAPRK